MRGTQWPTPGRTELCTFLFVHLYAEHTKMLVHHVYVFSSPLKGEDTGEGVESRVSPHPGPLPQGARGPKADFPCLFAIPDLAGAFL